MTLRSLRKSVQWYGGIDILPAAFISSHHYSILRPVHGYPAAFLVGNANNATSRATASVTSLLALSVSALAEVVSAGVDDNGAAKNALRPNQLDVLVGDTALANALSIGLEVS
jgi:hypothetical protein